MIYVHHLIYVCGLCNDKFSFQSDLEQQNDKKCTYCRIKSCAVKDHVKENHQENSEVKCYKCFNIFKNNKGLGNHMKYCENRMLAKYYSIKEYMNEKKNIKKESGNVLDIKEKYKTLNMTHKFFLKNIKSCKTLEKKKVNEKNDVQYVKVVVNIPIDETKDINKKINGNKYMQKSDIYIQEQNTLDTSLLYRDSNEIMKVLQSVIKIFEMDDDKSIKNKNEVQMVKEIKTTKVNEKLSSNVEVILKINTKSKNISKSAKSQAWSLFPCPHCTMRYKKMAKLNLHLNKFHCNITL